MERWGLGRSAGFRDGDAELMDEGVGLSDQQTELWGGGQSHWQRAGFRYGR